MELLTDSDYISPTLSWKDFRRRTFSRILKFRKSATLRGTTKRIFDILVESTTYDHLQGSLRVDVGEVTSKAVALFGDSKILYSVAKVVKDYGTANPDIRITWYRNLRKWCLVNDEDGKPSKKLMPVPVDIALGRVRSGMFFRMNPELRHPKGGWIYVRAKKMFTSAETDYPPRLKFASLYEKFQRAYPRSPLRMSLGTTEPY